VTTVDDLVKSILVFAACCLAASAVAFVLFSLIVAASVVPLN